jgi:lipid-binding SYLF domain-containing protein
MGGVSVGLSAGASAGQMAFLLMTDTARQAFDSTNNFSLNADAGLSVVNWSARAQGSMGKGEDVIVWSDTSGLFAGASVGVSDVFVDNEENRALYGPQANAQSILSGRVQNVPAAAAAMRQALASNRSGASRGTEMAAQNSGAAGRGDLSAPGEDNRPQRQARADRN